MSPINSSPYSLHATMHIYCLFQMLEQVKSDCWMYTNVYLLNNVKLIKKDQCITSLQLKNNGQRTGVGNKWDSWRLLRLPLKNVSMNHKSMTFNISGKAVKQISQNFIHMLILYQRMFLKQ